MIPREVLPDPGGRAQSWLQRLSKGAVAKYSKTHASDPWPFSSMIERLGRLLRECKTWLPLTGGTTFLVALAQVAGSNDVK